MAIGRSPSVSFASVMRDMLMIMTSVLFPIKILGWETQGRTLEGATKRTTDELTSQALCCVRRDTPELTQLRA